MDDKWLSKIAGKYVQFREYKDTLHFTIRQGWVEDNPKDPRHVTVQLDGVTTGTPYHHDDSDSHRLFVLTIEHIQCVLPDKINIHRTITYLCGGKCPVKGVEVYRQDVEASGNVGACSPEYS